MSAASKPTHRNKDHTNTDFKLINHRKRLVYFNTLSGRHEHFHWFLEEFSSPTEWLLNQEIKLKLKRYHGLCSSFRQEDTEETSELRWVTKKTNRVKYLNPKLTTTNQNPKNQINNTKKKIFTTPTDSCFEFFFSEGNLHVPKTITVKLTEPIVLLKDAIAIEDSRHVWGTSVMWYVVLYKSSSSWIIVTWSKQNNCDTFPAECYLNQLCSQQFVAFLLCMPPDLFWRIRSLWSTLFSWTLNTSDHVTFDCYKAQFKFSCVHWRILRQLASVNIGNLHKLILSTLSWNVRICCIPRQMGKTSPKNAVLGMTVNFIWCLRFSSRDLRSGE